MREWLDPTEIFEVHPPYYHGVPPVRPAEDRGEWLRQRITNDVYKVMVKSAGHCGLPECRICGWKKGT